MNSLLWKEWHENKRYLAVFMAWMLLAVCFTLGYEMVCRLRAVVGAFSGYALMYTLCATIFLGMRVAQGERTAGTLTFSAALPVSLRRMGTYRIVGAVVTLTVPILVAAILLSVALANGLVEQALPRDMANRVSLTDRDTAPLLTALEQLWCVAAIAALAGVESLLVLSFFGCRLRNQAQVGLLGAVLAFATFIAGVMLWFGAERNPNAQLIYGAFLPQSLAIQWGYGTDAGSYTDQEIAGHAWLALGLAVPLLILLGRLFVTRYGSLRNAPLAARPRRFRLTMPTISSRIPFRWPGRLGALLWLELRQSVPLAIFGLMLAVLMSVASVGMDGRQGQAYGDSLLAQMPHSTTVVAILWAAVVGASLYSAELGDGLGAFWRSRPIPTGMWFSCKFLVGLVAVLAVLDGTTILVSWSTSQDTVTEMGWAYVGSIPIVHAVVYALAVLGTCWLRKPVLGGFLAAFGFGTLSVAMQSFPAIGFLEPIHIHNQLMYAERAGQLDFSQHGYPLVYGTLAVSVVLIALLAYRAARPLTMASRWLVPSEA
jgi:hypothetical protein